MKYWTSEHVYNHPWHTVVNAAYRKYPNPMNGSVTAMDVIQQKVKKGVLMTERILQSHFHIPGWATKLTGFSGTQYSHEYTEIDPINKIMTFHTRNLNCLSFLRVDERLTYLPDSTNSNYTILRQEASVSVNLPAFTDYCEKAFLSSYQINALKGRKGMEWVIDHLRKEYSGITAKVSSEMQELFSHAHPLTSK